MKRVGEYYLNQNVGVPAGEEPGERGERRDRELDEEGALAPQDDQRAQREEASGHLVEPPPHRAVPPPLYQRLELRASSSTEAQH